MRSGGYCDDGSQNYTIMMNLVYMTKTEIKFLDLTCGKSFAGRTSSCS